MVKQGQKTKDTERIKDLKYRARRYSIKEGIFASARASFGDYYLSPFAIAINASNSLVAFLVSVQGLLGPLSQIFGSRLIEKYPRKKIILRTVFLELIMWLPLLLVAILFYTGIIVNILPILFLLIFSFYIIFSNIGAPAWFSWAGDLIDEKYRGRWFSKRNFIMGFISIVLALIASFFLDFFKKNNWTMFGFVALFSLALISRFISWRIFKKQYEPQIKLKKSDYFSFTKFLVNARKTNFGKFAIFRGLFGFAMAIASPLFVIYLLRYLNFSYSTYMLITLSGTVFSLLIMEFWGRFADKYGNCRVLLITSILIPIIPILWVLSPSPIYLIFVPMLVSGISWSGFTLSSGNFIYDNVSKEKRGLAVSYFNMLDGIGVFFGACLGAFLIKYLTVSFIEPILLIFIISGLARMIVVLFFIPGIKEIRKTDKFKGKKAFRNIILKQLRPTLHEEAHQIMSIKKYLRV